VADYKGTDWGRITKANLSWSGTWANYCLFVASLYIIVLQLNLIKLKLEVLKSGFKDQS